MSQAYEKNYEDTWSDQEWTLAKFFKTRLVLTILKGLYAIILLLAILLTQSACSQRKSQLPQFSTAVLAGGEEKGGQGAPNSEGREAKEDSEITMSEPNTGKENKNTAPLEWFSNVSAWPFSDKRFLIDSYLKNKNNPSLTTLPILDVSKKIGIPGEALSGLRSLQALDIEKLCALQQDFKCTEQALLAKEISLKTAKIEYSDLQNQVGDFKNTTHISEKRNQLQSLEEELLNIEQSLAQTQGALFDKQAEWLQEGSRHNEVLKNIEILEGEIQKIRNEQASLGRVEVKAELDRLSQTLAHASSGRGQPVQEFGFMQSGLPQETGFVQLGLRSAANWVGKWASRAFSTWNKRSGSFEEIIAEKDKLLTVARNSQKPGAGSGGSSSSPIDPEKLKRDLEGLFGKIEREYNNRNKEMLAKSSEQEKLEEEAQKIIEIMETKQNKAAEEARISNLLKEKERIKNEIADIKSDIQQNEQQLAQNEKQYLDKLNQVEHKIKTIAVNLNLSVRLGEYLDSLTDMVEKLKTNQLSKDVWTLFVFRLNLIDFELQTKRILSEDELKLAWLKLLKLGHNFEQQPDAIGNPNKAADAFVSGINELESELISIDNGVGTQLNAANSDLPDNLISLLLGRKIGSQALSSLVLIYADQELIKEMPFADSTAEDKKTNLTPSNLVILNQQTDLVFKDKDSKVVSWLKILKDRGLDFNPDGSQSKDSVLKQGSENFRTETSSRIKSVEMDLFSYWLWSMVSPLVAIEPQQFKSFFPQLALETLVHQKNFGSLQSYPLGWMRDFKNLHRFVKLNEAKISRNTQNRKSFTTDLHRQYAKSVNSKRSPASSEQIEPEGHVIASLEESSSGFVKVSSSAETSTFKSWLAGKDLKTEQKLKNQTTSIGNPSTYKAGVSIGTSVDMETKRENPWEEEEKQRRDHMKREKLTFSQNLDVVNYSANFVFNDSGLNPFAGIVEMFKTSYMDGFYGALSFGFQIDQKNCELKVKMVEFEKNAQGEWNANRTIAYQGSASEIFSDGDIVFPPVQDVSVYWHKNQSRFILTINNVPGELLDQTSYHFELIHLQGKNKNWAQFFKDYENKCFP